MTATTPPATALDAMAAARRQQIDARAALAAVEVEHRDARHKLDELLRTPAHLQSNPDFQLSKRRAEEHAIEVAERRETTRASVAVIEEESSRAIAESFDAWIADHDAQLHELALKVDEGLAQAADAMGEMVKLSREAMTVRSQAGYRPIQSERLERNLATIVLNKLPLSPLRRLGSWTPSRKLGDKAAAIWPAEGARIVEHESK